MKSKSANRFLVASVAAFTAITHTASAVDITKGDSINLLDLGTSWAGGTAPSTTDVATWAGAYATAGSLSAAFTASTPVSWQGIKIGNITGTAAGLVSIGGTANATTGSKISIGSSGIDMSVANQNLVINAATIELLGATQVWDTGTAKNLRLGTTGTGSANANLDGTAGTVITIQGTGVVDANQGGGTGYTDAAGFAGFNGKWVIESGATLRGIRNGATAWGSSTAADAITLKGGTLAVGGISGTQGNWTWNTKMTLADGTASSLDNQLFSGTNRYLKLEGAIAGGSLNTGTLTFKNTSSGVMNNDEYGYILSGANTFTGGMTINASTYVRIGGSNAGSANSDAGNNGSLASALAITNNGVLRLTRNDAWILGNNISGSGQLKIGGTLGTTTAQVVTVSGTNSYSGATTVVNGTLKAGVASVANVSGAFGKNSAVSIANVATAIIDLNGFDTQIGSLTGGGTTGGNIILGAKTLTVGGDNTSPATYAGVISGASGSLSKIGTGTLILSGTNTYTGVTTIRGNNGTSGELRVSSIKDGGVAGNLGQATNIATNIVFGESGLTTGKLVYTGAGENTDRLFTINGNAIIENNGSGALNFTGTGDIGKTSGILQSLTLGGTNGGSLAANIIKGAGSSNVEVNKAGAGTWTLSSSGSTYTGATKVTQGTLVINGSISTSSLTTVDSGATLGGSGTVGALTVNGTFAPGNSIESMGSGALSFGATSTYAYELQTNLYGSSPGVAGDLAYSSGTLNIATGSILTLTDLATNIALANGSKLTLISYTGAWNNGLFSYLGSPLADDATFTLGANQWKFNYNDTVEGVNFTSDSAGNFVTMTVVPEPGAALLGGLGMLVLLRRRRA